MEPHMAVASAPPIGSVAPVRAYRPPTYRAGGRLATLVLVLAARPDGVDLRALEAEFGISERTRMRYVAALERELPGLVYRSNGRLRLHRDWRAACGGGAA